MTVALANPNPVNMPGYNNPDLDEVHSLPRYCSLLFSSSTFFSGVCLSPVLRIILSFLSVNLLHLRIYQEDFWIKRGPHKSANMDLLVSKAAADDENKSSSLTSRSLLYINESFFIWQDANGKYCPRHNSNRFFNHGSSPQGPTFCFLLRTRPFVLDLLRTLP